MKLKIAQKGLVLVAVPLVFGTAFISLVYCGLSRAELMIQRELKLKNAMITFVTANRCATAAKFCMNAYLMAGRDPYYKQRYRLNKKKAIEANEHLKELLKDEPYLKAPELQLSPRDMIMRGIGQGGGGPADLVSAPYRNFLQQLKRLSDKQTSQALDAMNLLQAILIGGLLLSVVVSLCLVRFFCLKYNEPPVDNNGENEQPVQWNAIEPAPSGQ
jgi:hypothetical protein